MATEDAAAGGPRRGSGGREALALLLAINLFNYIDRQILSATLPKIQLDATIFRPDDPSRGTQTRPADDRRSWSRTCCCRRCSAGSGTACPRWVLVGVARDPLEPGDRRHRPRRRLRDPAALHALPRRGRRSGLRPGRPGDALGPVPGRAPRPRSCRWFYMAIPVGSRSGS